MVVDISRSSTQQAKATATIFRQTTTFLFWAVFCTHFVASRVFLPGQNTQNCFYHLFCLILLVVVLVDIFEDGFSPVARACGDIWRPRRDPTHHQSPQKTSVSRQKRFAPTLHTKAR